MNGFGPAVSGYFDVEGQLSRYLRRRAADHFSTERDGKRAIDSRTEFEARRERVRDDFLSAIGGLPDRPADLSVENRGVVDRDGYSVELLTYESRPDFHVTANCYVPDAEGPHPGVLFLCGHVDEAKTDEFNRKACAELALNGFVVLVVDPVAQGEREQYRDPETGDALVSGGGGVFAHCYAGQQCFYAGANIARYMIHDARCGLDYLHDRQDVDEDRIGVTGTSGGGIQTEYLMLVDDRIDAAAPCCAVTEREEWLQTGKSIDAEQNVYGAISREINYDDLVTAMAPRPVCVGAAASDQYFPVEGVHETHERARRVYDLYDAAENLDLVVADETHCSVYEFGDSIFEWLCDHLGAGEFESHEGGLAVADETELHCTPEGSVCAAFDDERTIDALIREYVAENCPDAGTTGTDGTDSPTGLRRTVTEKFDLDRERCDLHPRYVSESEWEGLTVEHVWFRTERDPDAVVAGVLVSDPESDAGSDGSGEPPAVVLYEEGTEELPERSEELASHAEEYGAVLAFDPRGVGAVRNRHVPIPNWVDDYYDLYGTEFTFAYDALMMETSLFAMRVYDVLRAVELLRSETGSEQVALVGEGVGAYHALYAAVADESVEAIGLRDLGPSFREMATSREYPYDPRLTVFDVIGDCDLPDLLAALDDRGLRNLGVERSADCR